MLKHGFVKKEDNKEDDIPKEKMSATVKDMMMKMDKKMDKMMKMMSEAK